MKPVDWQVAIQFTEEEARLLGLIAQTIRPALNEEQKAVLAGVAYKVLGAAGAIKVKVIEEIGMDEAVRQAEAQLARRPHLEDPLMLERLS